MKENDIYFGDQTLIKGGFSTAEKFLEVCRRNKLSEYADELTDISKFRLKKHNQLRNQQHNRKRNPIRLY